MRARSARSWCPKAPQGVKVNQPIALLLEEGEDKAALARRGQAAGRRAQARAAARGAATPAPEAAAARRRAPPRRRRAANGHGEGDRVFASPLARRMAEQAGLDLARITGSGPHGRIVKPDIEAALAKGPASAARRGGRARARACGDAGRRGGAELQPRPGGGARRQPRLHRAADHQHAARHRPAHGRIEADHPAFLPHRRLRDRRAAAHARRGQRPPPALKLSVNDFVIKAAALALRKVPAVNASWSEDAILQWQTADIAVAVAIEEGLITPIIKAADSKGLQQISAEMRDLGTRAPRRQAQARRSSRAAPSRSPISACTASRISPR